MKEYNTKQKEMLMSFLYENSHMEFTSDEILESLPSLSKSTFYRILQTLLRDGKLKCSVKDGRKCYSAVSSSCHGHLHLKCEKCNKYYHLSKEASDEIIRIIEDETGFSLEALNILATGLCKECVK